MTSEEQGSEESPRRMDPEETCAASEEQCLGESAQGSNCSSTIVNKEVRVMKLNLHILKHREDTTHQATREISSQNVY